MSQPGLQRSIRVLVALMSLVLAGAAAAADDRPEVPAYDAPRAVVVITEDALNPRLATLEEGQIVAWISYSPTASVVVFEREVARSMICHSLVNFSIRDHELRSAPIHAGEFASFCQLEPGRYRYQVVRPDAGEGAAAARRLEGEIVVGDPGS